MDTPDDELVYPGRDESLNNAFKFFSGFGQVAIPFMDNFEIQVVDDETDGVPNICFKNAVISMASKSALALLASAMFIF